MQCWKCHGVQGMANGPSAATCRTILVVPFFPTTSPRADGPSAARPIADIYKIFMTGLDGTPMPSFADNIKPDEAWDLVFYLRTLQPTMPSTRRKNNLPSNSD